MRGLRSMVWAGAIAVLAIAMAGSAEAAEATSTDWPSWRGPFSSGASDSGQEWVDTLDAARQAWVSDEVGLSGCGHGSPDHLATGFCDPVTVGDRVYLFWFERSGTNTVEWERIAHSRSFGTRRVSASYGNAHEAAEQAKFNADDVFVCLNARTGKTLWKRVFAERGFNHRKVYSPVCTPCVSDGRLYGLGSAGRVYCLDAATGKPIWESDVGLAAQHFEQMRALCRATGVRGYEPSGFEHCVMAIDGVVVIGDSGRPLSSTDVERGIVGLDARTGELLWQIPSCLEKYGTPSYWRHKGKEYVLTAGESRMIAVEPRNGRILWEHKAAKDGNGRVQQPVCPVVTLAVSGDYVVVNGSAPACYRMDLSGARKVWELLKVESYAWLVGAVILGDHAYVSVKGGVGCVELETGTLLGTVAGFGAAGIRGYAGGDNHIVDSGLVVVKGWPDFRKLEEKLPGTWRAGYAHSSTVADGRVYIRGRDNVYCYDLRKNPPTDEGSHEPRSTATSDLDAAKDDPIRLVALAETTDWPTRGAAFERLREMGAAARGAAEKLEGMLRAAAAKADWGDTDLLVAALMAIEPARAKTTVVDLAKLLKSNDVVAVRLGCQVLGIIGPGAAEAVPALARLLTNRDASVAASAAKSLGLIGPDAASASPALLACLPEERPVETYETAAAAVRFDDYKRLDMLEARRLTEADSVFATKDYVRAKDAYEAFRKDFPNSIAVRYTVERSGKCGALMKTLADAAYDGAMDPTQDALTYHALNALFLIGATPTNRIPRMIDLAMKNPWVGRLGGDVLPQYKSYGVLLLRKLGPECVPMLLAKARALADAGFFPAVADVVQAACLLDPKAKQSGLKAIAYAIGPKPSGRMPYMGGESGQSLVYVQRDLEGTYDMTDPRGIIRSRRKTAEEAAKEKMEIPTVEEVILDL